LFFDEYPRFLETSRTVGHLNRLNKRHHAIFASVPSLFQGRRVLDIASHDGRWSFAALKAGAAHVFGIEPREHLVRNARETLAAYGCDRSSFRFEQGDVFEVLSKSEEKFDAVLCLGFFYHTYRHPELMALIKRCAPQVLVMDTAVHNEEGMLCRVKRDKSELEWDAAHDASTYKGETYAAFPTPALLKDMLTHFDFNYQEVDWRAVINLDGNTTWVDDYEVGRRVTMICRSVSESGS
jgi:protein-L-isoaspartate O-methyltransferase